MGLVWSVSHPIPGQRWKERLKIAKSWRGSNSWGSLKSRNSIGIDEMARLRRHTNFRKQNDHIVLIAERTLNFCLCQ